MTRRGVAAGGTFLLLLLSVMAGVTTETTVYAQTPTAPPAAPSPAVPLLRLSLPADDGTLTPYSFDGAYSFLTFVYDTLLWRDTGGVPRPWLAQSIEMSADGRSVTVRLAEGARWHDGPPVTSEDVAFTFRYVKARFHPRFTPQLSAVTGVEATDPQTAVITLSRPSPGFSDLPLADLPILPAHLWGSLPAGKPTPDGLAVGSGPYRLFRYTPGGGYGFEANASYFRGAPAVARIEVSILGTGEEAFSATVRHTVDMVPYKPPIDELGALPNLALRLARGPSYLGTALTFNVRRPPFDRAEARAAVVGALDRDRIARVVGDAVPASRGFVHPESRWAPEAALVVGDQAAARTTLATLGLPTVEVLAPESDPVKREAARQVALALQRAGQQAVARPVPADQFAAAVSGSDASFMAAVESVPPLVSYDPDFLNQLFGPGGQSHSGYSDPAFNSMAERVATTADPTARRIAVGEELALLARDVPSVPLVFVNGTFAYRPSVFNGWVYIKGTGILDKRSFVEPARLRQPEPSVAPEGKGSGGLRWTQVVLVLVAVATAGVIAALVKGRDWSA